MKNTISGFTIALIIAVFSMGLQIPAMAASPGVGPSDTEVQTMASTGNEVSARAKLVVNPASHVSGDKILLGDIAKLSGDDADLIEKVRDVYIAKTPRPGKEVRLTKSFLTSRISAHRIDLDAVDISAPEQILVSRNSIEIPGEDLVGLARRYVLEHLPYDPKKAGIFTRYAPESVFVQEGKVTFAVSPRPKEDYLGLVPIQVVIKVDGHEEKRVWVRLDVEMPVPVVLARRRIEPDTVIRAGDLYVTEKDLARLAGGAVTDPAQVVGMRARRPIAPNAVLRADMVEAALILKRGDIITLVAGSGNLIATARGEAQEKGRTGDWIKVRNISSHRIIYGRVVDSNTVRVEF